MLIVIVMMMWGISMTMIYLQVRLKRIIAIIGIDLERREVLTIECSNVDFCRDAGILSECCPGYCEILVAAKDFAYGRRMPKAEVIELNEIEV